MVYCGIDCIHDRSDEKLEVFYSLQILLGIQLFKSYTLVLNILGYSNYSTEKLVA